MTTRHDWCLGVKFGLTLVVLLLLSLTVLPNVMHFSTYETRENGKSEPTECSVSTGWIHQSVLHFFDWTPRCRNPLCAVFPTSALRWLGPLGAAVTQLVTVTSYEGWFIKGDSTAKPNSLSWLCLPLTHPSLEKTACCSVPAVSVHDGRYSRASIQQCLLQNWEQTSSVQQESRCPVKTAVTSQALQTIILDTNSCTV